jgi:selenocysteine-specific elongation factor
MIIAAGSAGVDVKTIPVRSGAVPGEANRELEKLNCVIVASKAYAPAAIKELEATVHTFISSEIANHPLDTGVSLQTVRAGIDAAAEVIDLVLARLEKRRGIEVADSLVKPFGWVSTLGQREQALSDAILHEICTQAAEPPSVTELVERFGPETRAMLRRLERQGALERVSDDRYYGSEVVAGMIGTVRSGLSPGRIYSPAELREVLGVSRKYLIPFLEFCDRKGVTERRENGRRVRQGA